MFKYSILFILLLCLSMNLFSDGKDKTKKKIVDKNSKDTTQPNYQQQYKEDLEDIFNAISDLENDLFNKLPKDKLEANKQELSRLKSALKMKTNALSDQYIEIYKFYKANGATEKDIIEFNNQYLDMIYTIEAEIYDKIIKNKIVNEKQLFDGTDDDNIIPIEVLSKWDSLITEIISQIPSGRKINFEKQLKDSSKEFLVSILDEGEGNEAEDLRADFQNYIKIRKLLIINNISTESIKKLDVVFTEIFKYVYDKDISPNEIEKEALDK